MNVLNVHERKLLTSPEDAWRLIANLGGKHELLWPRGWPRVRFDRPLGQGASGGHGPIGYCVEQYSPPELIRFRFTRPNGYDGYHEFRILPEIGGLRFQHTLRMRTRGLTTWVWLLALRPLHDALLEDLMDRASTYSSGHEFTSRWSPWVRILRWLAARPGLAAASSGREARETRAVNPPAG